MRRDGPRSLEVFRRRDLHCRTDAGPCTGGLIHQAPGRPAAWRMAGALTNSSRASALEVAQYSFCSARFRETAVRAVTMLQRRWSIAMPDCNDRRRTARLLPGF